MPDPSSKLRSDPSAGARIVSSVKALFNWWRPNKSLPVHLERGRLGEDAARTYLGRRGLKFLAANYEGRGGEIDLVFRDGECLVFVEVKARAAGSWTRPAAAVDEAKRRRVSRTALDYLAEIGNPRVKFRFDIVEAMLEGNAVQELRHLPDAFPLHRRYRYV
ncbi:MAG: YraN family protein [Verrucomicrobia bacterium]|nr:MAG: YraN family protein [Verrucomicrobiota bacterium]